MVNERLYYEDARLLSFTASVVERREMALAEAVREAAQEVSGSGLFPAVRLDRTAFYPTSGGQPHDIGTLDGVQVIEVLEDDAGKVWHLLAGPLESSGRVSGEIDGARRFDHMQQHSGQHLLSASFERLLSASTVGFHLGREASSIDLALPDLSWEEAWRIEDETNAVVWENRAVAVQVLGRQHVIDAEAYLGLPLRKPPIVSGDIRVILVDGYDASACGGTHVSATGEIGVVKIVGIERYKGGVRVTFRCGGRALRDYQQAQQLLHTASTALSVGKDALPEAIARIEERERAARLELRQLRATLMVHEAEELWRSAQLEKGVHVILAYDSEKTPAELRALAGLLREHERTLVLLAAAGGASADDRQGLHLVVARSADLTDLNAAALLRSATGLLGGRGGGSPSLAQGGTPPHASERVVAAFRRVLDQWAAGHEHL